MAVEQCNLPSGMIPHTFPAKLWRIVNEPRYRSMRWDPCGEGIVVDQEFFEAEILAPRGIVPKHIFKVTSLGSFFRQLNLYGFRKVGFAPGDSGHHVGNLGGEARSLHHFCNAFFRRDNPELLFKLKRLTNINKAKLAAGFKGNARPQNRYPRILPNPQEEQRRAKSQGLMPPQQNKHFTRHENISLYPRAGPVSQSHSVSSIKEFVDMPVSTKMLPSSLGPHQGYFSVPSPFPERPVHFPLVQQVPTQVAYTLQSTATSLHVQQGHSVMMESVQNYGSSLPMQYQYPSAYYPAAMFQGGYPPSYTECPPSFSNPVLLYNPHNYYQGPPVQAPHLVEFYNPNLPHTNYNDFRRDQANLNTAVWVSDDMQASHQPEMAQLGVQVNHRQPLSISNYGHVIETFEHGQTPQLQYIMPVNMDITSCAARSYQAAPFLHTQASGGAYPSSSNTERPLMQPPYPMEVFHPYLPHTNFADFSRAQVNLDTAVQVVDDLQASHPPEMAQLAVQEDHKESLSSSNDGHVPETFEHSQTQQLECLLAVNMDITNCAAKSYQTAPYLHTQASDVHIR